MKEIYRYDADKTSKAIWESVKVKANSTCTFTSLEGPGIIKKLWLSSFPIGEKEDLELAENVFLKIYWDNSPEPAIDVPLSDFFCQSLKLQAIENHLFQSTNNQLLFTTTMPMPYKQKVKMEVESRLTREFELFFGIDIEYQDLEEDTMYLHSHWQQLNDLSSDRAFHILPEIIGKGRYIGTHLSIHQRKTLKNWPWYTRPISIFIDSTSENTPSIHINTIDDFFGSAWWDREPGHNVYAYQYFGRPLVDIHPSGDMAILLYKYHLQDSIWFHEKLEIIIGENWNWNNQGIASGDWTSVCFYYLKVG